MDHKQSSLVQHSWEIVISKDLEMPFTFYKKLFELNPEYRPLFAGDIKVQSQKLMAHFTYIINNLSNWSKLHDELIALGQRHTGYRVTRKDYAVGADALLHALKVVLKEDWTGEVEEAYLALYNTVVDAMTMEMVTKQD